MTTSDDTERVLQSFLKIARAAPPEADDTERALQSFLGIAKAASPMEATALAAVHQEKAISKLNSSVADLVSGSKKLYWLTLGLMGLTAILTVCTLVLVRLTYVLTLP